MRILRLKLNNFRNYSSLDIRFANQFNIIYGNNAQGKTNIIEAIFLCASGRSHRTSKDSELIKNGESVFNINILIEKENISQEIDIVFNNEQRKRIKINDCPVRRIGDLMGHLNAVIFSPEDLLLIKQGPAERRRFIDITLSQIKPSYFYDLQKYAKIIYQRNSLLKEIAFKRGLEDTLEVWDCHLIKTGTRIMKERIKFVSRLNELAGKRHVNLTNNEEKLSLRYNPSFDCGDHMYDLDSDGLENCFQDLLIRNRERELKKGNTIFGPHRDDLEIMLNGQTIKIYGSQGQQRTSVLSMKLAEIDLLKEESGDWPVLLLDDVLSELDDNRKEYLLNSIENVQTFITATDNRFLCAEKNDAAFFYVKAGNIKLE